ncbi:hypothetical protein L332_00285 [Agrococcus pavilionensis RW1]|uniref:DUF4229 domain-containing protein n=1 Tax=Agrococcus pavilionensis RW1 TaxID=1330458 RepID=U1MM12_9MICO|nr:DUF4229 domain-containing protein [Agrococcus pavilionensis]ERG62906.1 hypothetical protein L332_00285 [Agrococcus pavilionensis RW1]
MGPSMRYLVVRAALFLVPFALLMIADVPWPISLLVALAFAFAASIVFFGKLRDEAARDLQRMRQGRKREGAGPDDADIEDEALDAGAARDTGVAPTAAAARDADAGAVDASAARADLADAAPDVPPARPTDAADGPDASGPRP